MKIFILLDMDYDNSVEVIACYTTKTAADTHMRLVPGALLREAELDGPLPEHEDVTRYEAWMLSDFDNPTFQDTACTITPGGPRRGWNKSQAYCFWSYESREDALLVMSEFKQSEDFNEKLVKMQVALYGRVM